MTSPLSPTRAELLSPTDELDRYATPFERAHHYGSRRYPGLWMKANMAAIEVARMNHFDHTDPNNKTLLSQLTLRVLDVALNGRTQQL